MKQKPEEFALEYAGFWIRLGAQFIDASILLLIACAISKIVSTLYHICGLSTGLLPREILHSVYGVLLLAIISAIVVAYFVCFWIWRGQTPGKMMTGIKIIRTNNSPLDWSHALLRFIGYIVSILTLFIGLIWIAFDSHKQGLHDKVADTYVVKLPVRQVTFTGDYARGQVG